MGIKGSIVGYRAEGNKSYSEVDLGAIGKMREGSDGIADLRVYGAHEHALSEHRTGEEGMWIGERWIPPL